MDCREQETRSRHTRFGTERPRCRNAYKNGKCVRTHVHGQKTSDRRVLIAARDMAAAWNTHLQLERSDRWQVVGIVDPRITATFYNGCEEADIVLIEAGDLNWLLDHQPVLAQTIFERSPPMVLLKESDILDIVTRSEHTWGLLLEQKLSTLSVERLALACDGYLVIATGLLSQLRADGLRLGIIETLSPEELSVLSYLGAALPNREIAEKSRMPEKRVKALARNLARKLRLKNRTALAVFAVENEVLLSRLAAKAPESPGPVQRIRSNVDVNG